MAPPILTDKDIERLDTTSPAIKPKIPMDLDISPPLSKPKILTDNDIDRIAMPKLTDSDIDLDEAYNVGVKAITKSKPLQAISSVLEKSFLPFAQIKTIKDISENTYFQSLTSGAYRILSQNARIPALIYDIGALPQNVFFKATKQPEQFVRSPEWLIDNPVSKFFDKSAESLDYTKKRWLDKGEDFTTLLDKKKYTEATEFFLHQFTANIPNTAMLIAGGTAGFGNKMLTLMGANVAADVNKRARERNLDPVKSIANAATQGTFEAMFERMGTMGLFKKWSTSLVDTFGKANTKEIIKNTTKAIFHSFLGEGWEEYITEYAQSFSDYALGDNPAAMKGVNSRALFAAGIGGLSGASITAPTAILTAQQSAKAKNLIESIETVNEVAKQFDMEKFTTPEIPPEIKPIPPELQPLAEEARKYKSVVFDKAVEEFGIKTDIKKMGFIGKDGRIIETISTHQALAEAVLPKQYEGLEGWEKVSKFIEITGAARVTKGEGKAINELFIEAPKNLTQEQLIKIKKMAGNGKIITDLIDKGKVTSKIFNSFTDFYNQVKGKVPAEGKIPEIPPEIKPIPPELQPLAEEARKYKSAEEFIDSEPVYYLLVEQQNKEILNTINKAEKILPKNLLKEYGINKDAPESLSWQAMKNFGFKIEENIRRTYNYYAKEQNKPLAETVMLGKDPDNPMKDVRIKIEDGKDIDESILNQAKKSLQKVNNFIEEELSAPSVELNKSQLTDFYNQVKGKVPAEGKILETIADVETKLNDIADKIDEDYSAILSEGETPTIEGDINIGKQPVNWEERERYLQVTLAEKINPHSAREVLLKLAEDLGLTINKITIVEERGKYGSYNPETKDVRISYLDNIRTFIHEILGHMFDDALGNLFYADRYTPSGKTQYKKLIDKVYNTVGWTKKQIDKTNATLMSELKGVAKYVRPDLKKLDSKELFANYMPLLLIDYGKARQIAPTFTEAFIAVLRKNPKIYDTISKFFVEDVSQNPIYSASLPYLIGEPATEKLSKIWTKLVDEFKGVSIKDKTGDIEINIMSLPEKAKLTITDRIKYFFSVPLGEALWHKKFNDIFRAIQDSNYNYNKINSDVEKELDKKFLLSLPKKSAELIKELIYQGNRQKTYYGINVDIDIKDLKVGAKFRSLNEVGEPTYIITEILPNNSFKALNEKDYKYYGALVQSQFEKTFTIYNGELTTKFFANENEIRGYKKILRAVNTARNALIEYAKESMGYYDLLDQVAKTQLEADIISFIDRFRGYFPLERDGDIALYALAPDEDTIWYELSYDKNELLKRVGELKKMGYTNMRIYDVKKPPAELLKHINRLSWWQLDNIVEAAGISSNDPVVKKLKTYLLKKQGFRHLLKRSFIPGFERTLDNVIESVEAFGRNAARRYTKLKARKQANKLLKAVDPYKEKILFNYSSRYVRNYFESTPQEYRLLNTFIYSYYLALKPQFPILNSLQFWMTTYGNIANYVKGFKAEKIALQTHKVISQYLFSELANKQSNISSEILQFIERWKADGVIDPVLTEEILSLKYPFKKNFKNVIGYFGMISEKFNRLRSGIAGYYTGKELKLYGEDLYKFTRQFVEKSDFPFNKGALPLVITDAGGIRPLLKSMYIFQGYQYHYLNILFYTTMKGKAGAKLRMWGVLLSIAGLSGLVGFSLSDWLLKRFGINIKLEIRKLIKNPKIADLAIKGAPALIGIDLSRSVGFGDIVNPFETTAEQIFGAPYGTVKRIVRGLYTLGVEKEPLRGFAQILPSAISYPLSAYIGAKEGVRTARLRPLFEPTAYETGLKAMGFMPLRQAKEYEFLEAQSYLTQRPKEIKSKFLRQLAMARLRKNDNAYQQIISQLTKYNNSARPDQRIIITNKELNEKIKGLSFEESDIVSLKKIPKKARPEIIQLRKLYR